MSRLIDADALKRDLKSVTLSNGTLVNANTILALLDKYPTAYDVDKVVEQLEDYLFEKYCVEGDTKIEEIVKGGGADAGGI